MGRRCLSHGFIDSEEDGIRRPAPIATPQSTRDRLEEVRAPWANRIPKVSGFSHSIVFLSRHTWEPSTACPIRRRPPTCPEGARAKEEVIT